MTIEEAKLVLLLNIVAPTEEDPSAIDLQQDARDEIYSRWKECIKSGDKVSAESWKYILSPIENEKDRNKLIELFSYEG